MRNTNTYKALPYNPKLKARARALRKAGMLHEALLWNQLKRKKLNGLDFDRQKIIGNYIVDFFCSEHGVVVEVDGASHHSKFDKDAERSSYLTSLGLVLIRVPVKDVLQNLEGVMLYLQNHSALTIDLHNHSRKPQPKSN